MPLHGPPCSFLVESMEEEFAQIVGVNAALWCILLVSVRRFRCGRGEVS